MEQNTRFDRFWQRPRSAYLPVLILLAAVLVFLSVVFFTQMHLFLHIYEDTVVPPTCGAHGYTLHTCRLCGDSYSDTFTYSDHEYTAPYTVRDPSESTLGISTSYCIHCGDVKRTEIPMTIPIPVVYLEGTLPPDKENPSIVTLSYRSSTTAFKTTAQARIQGLTSAWFPKRNYNLRFYTDDTMQVKNRIDLGYGEWGDQWKYTLKANWIDRSHARNIVCCRIFSQMVETRKTPNKDLLSAPNNGVIDGFPVRVYHNGEYHGLYTMNISKDKWMFGIDEQTHPYSAIITAQMHNVSNRFQQTTDLANTVDWDLEYCSTGTDIAWVNKSFNDFISFVINTTDVETFRARAHEYMDVEAVIDYIWMYTMVYGTDNAQKNVIFVTYDGKRWIPNYYDADSSFGLHWDGRSFHPNTTLDNYLPRTVTINRAINDNYLHSRVAYCFYDEFVARYWELRKTVISNENIIATFEEFFDSVPASAYAEDRAKWALPDPIDESGNMNDIGQIRYYVNRHMPLLDNAVRNLVRR